MPPQGCGHTSSHGKDTDDSRSLNGCERQFESDRHQAGCKEQKNRLKESSDYPFEEAPDQIGAPHFTDTKRHDPHLEQHRQTSDKDGHEDSEENGIGIG